MYLSTQMPSEKAIEALEKAKGLVIEERKVHVLDVLNTIVNEKGSENPEADDVERAMRVVLSTAVNMEKQFTSSYLQQPRHNSHAMGALLLMGTTYIYRLCVDASDNFVIERKLMVNAYDNTVPFAPVFMIPHSIFL